MSQPVFEEIAEVLRRPGLSRYLDPIFRDDLLDQLLTGTEWFVPTTAVLDCRDAADNKYLELALIGEADAIVTGDRDLLVLDPWRNVRIVRPRTWLDLV
jgi:putative PIN family toxin of toxin-antitoxin system